MESPITLSGHLIGLLKEYMKDLVEQAVQEGSANERFGFTPPAYGHDDAISDLLALLDDRSESEGLEVGLPDYLLHAMWAICHEGASYINDRVWLETNLSSQPMGKVRIREITYRALIDLIEMRYCKKIGS